MKIKYDSDTSTTFLEFADTEYELDGFVIPALHELLRVKTEAWQVMRKQMPQFTEQDFGIPIIRELINGITDREEQP